MNNAGSISRRLIPAGALIALCIAGIAVGTGAVLMLIISAVYLLICKNLYAERKSEQ